jgi:uncharacterized protein
MTEPTPPHGGEPPKAVPSHPDAQPEASLAGDPMSAASMAAAPVEQKLFQSPALVYAFLRLCIYLALAYGISFALPLALKPFLRRAISPLAPRLLMAGELIGLTGVLAAAWIMSRLEKRSFGEYGLPGRSAFGKNFWMGAVLGLTEITAVIGVMTAFGAYHFGAIAIHGSTLIRWAIFWALFFLVVGFYEEFQFRGYVQFTASQALGFWLAAALLSVAFGVVHLANSGENWVGAAGVALTGVLWCFTLRRTGSLWLAVGMHASFDFGETFLYSVPDSGLVFPGHLSNSTISGPTWLTGGSVGPEGSVFDFVMLILFFFIIHRLYPAQATNSMYKVPRSAEEIAG